MTLDLSGLEVFKASGLLETPAATVSPSLVPLDLIDFDPDQPRRTVSEGALRALAGSIRDQGVLEPVCLRSHPQQSGRFVVNRGERRVRASRMAGLTCVPAFIDERVDPYAQVIENLQREDLSPFDLARFVAQREQAGDTKATIARRLHKPRSFVTELAALNAAPDSLREAFDAGRVRDLRVLYRMARQSTVQPEAVDSMLRTSDAVTRDSLEAAMGMHAPACTASDAATSASRRVHGTRLARALLVEHQGRRAVLRLSRPPGGRTADLHFEDGSRSLVGLDEVRLIEWAED